jgi:guanosine-3',5'-bis(diphosphate) 3'-pyrophosphohydrolase
MTFQEFLSAIPHTFKPAEQTVLARALEFAESAHAGQMRKNGEEYIIHPLQAGIIVGHLFPDPSTIAATLLHDVPENTTATTEDIQNLFGSEIARLVDGVTKLGSVRLRGSTDAQYLENLRKMFIATSQDVRVMIVKLADRLHNMRTIAFLPPDKQEKIARETLEIYAPIAGRLGIGSWKDELEDLSFGIVDPAGLAATTQSLDLFLQDRQKLFEELQTRLNTILQTEHITYQKLYGRIKRIYSLHTKIQKLGGDINRCLDIVAFRITTNSTADCYAALGAIHKYFQPVPGRIRDYIGMPKPNGYQSLHTVVFHNGTVFEVQIRTDLMHEQAERGVAAHWFYTESGKQSDKVKSQLAWMSELRRWQDDADPAELLENMKIDAFQDRIFVLTPQGDAINLPQGATPIDFAFAVHSDLGYYMMGAKVNDKMVKLSTELEQGDVVEIIKSKKLVRISPDWLKNARTRHARAHIRQHLKQQTENYT